MKKNCVSENVLEIKKCELLSPLPDLMTFNSGVKVNSITDWKDRRKELFETAVNLQYGDVLPNPEFLEIEALFKTETNSVYRIKTGKKEKPISFTMRVFLPSGKEKAPIIIDGDLSFNSFYNDDLIRTATKNGIGWALFDRCEICSDAAAGVKTNKELTKPMGQIVETYPEYKLTALTAWAWGYSRVADAIIKLGIVENNLITFTGLSRGGKTAILAGVIDERAVIVNPFQTCAGGCSCYRVHLTASYNGGKESKGETLYDIINYFPYWFNPELKKYEKDEKNLPFDSHYLKALVAPRTLLVVEGSGDIWANPPASVYTTLKTKPAYELYNAEDNLLWYVKDGGHDYTVNDIEILCSVILNKLNGTPIHKDMFRLPFDLPENLI